MNNDNNKATDQTKANGELETVGRSVSKRVPWNYGKRKPVEDDCGNKWCNCLKPKLTSNSGGPGQAYCLLCGNFWYN